MNKKSKYFKLLVLIVISCNIKKKDSDIRDDLLISSTSEIVMEDGELASNYYEDRKEFIKPYVMVKYLKDTIKATTLHEINSCGKAVGSIILSNDTIFLSTKNMSDEVCASVQFNKFTYLIKNPTNKKYTVIF